MTYREGLKFRHLFGEAEKLENSYQDIRVSKSAWDSNWVTVNPKYLGICWGSSGGGSFAVLPLTHTGKLQTGFPLFTGHSGTVLDLQFNPFNVQLIASASEDCSVRIWKVPEEFGKTDIK